MVYEKVRIIEFEATTTCNSFCPVCARFKENDHGVYLNPLVDFNQHLSIENITKILTDSCVDDNVLIEFIGTAGDPLAHPNFLEILETAITLKPNARFNIHTNGGLRNPDYYEKIAKLLKSTRHYYFQFSIDGLEDTNHIYRIGVQWHRVIDNLKAFIKAGGIPSWQMVLFPWNKHQVNEARNFAKELGCKSFDTRNNVYSADLDLLMSKAKTKFYKTETMANEDLQKLTQFENFKEEIEYMVNNYKYIEDSCVSKEGIFVRPEGYIYPCCMFSAAAYDLNQQKILEEAYFTPYEKNWNEIEKHSLTTIMNNKWWTDLKTGLDNNKGCDLCIQQCGVVDDIAKHDLQSERVNFNENY